MPAPIRGALQGALHALREFTVAQRTIALIGLAAVVVAAVAVGVWVTRPQYAPLYSGLSGADASAIVDQLTTADVPYELADGGTTILVPQDKVAEQRIAAAAAGLPGSESGGYALLDSMGVTASEFQQSVTFKRALEGELARTLKGLSGVRAASVQLAIPEQSVFAQEEAPTTASVFLETASGVTLTEEQILAVQNLVSSAVPRLAVADVAVVDQDGKLLSATEDASSQSGPSDYEEKLRTQVQAMLDRIVGPGNATVAVTAEVQTESAQRVEERFTSPEGDEDLVLQESSTAEIYGPGAQTDTQAGVLGPDNISVPTGGTATGEDGYSNTTVDRVNAVDKTTETRTIPAGALVRQSVSIAVDQEAAAGLDAGTIEDLVAAAAGIDTERGDQIQVELVTFAAASADAATAALEEGKAAEAQAQMQELLQTGIIAGSVVIVLVVLIVTLSRGRKRRADAVDVGDVPASPVGPTLDAVDDQPAVAGYPQAPAVAAPAAPVAPLAPAAENDLERARAVVDSLAATDPQRAADYLRRLMDEPAGVR